METKTMVTHVDCSVHNNVHCVTPLKLHKIEKSTIKSATPRRNTKRTLKKQRFTEILKFVHSKHFKYNGRYGTLLILYHEKSGLSTGNALLLG